MEIGKRLAEERMRYAADLRRDIRFYIGMAYAILSEGKHNNNNNNGRGMLDDRQDTASEKLVNAYPWCV